VTCNEQGFQRCGVELGYDEILAMLGETVSESKDFMARTMMKGMFIGVKECGYSEKMCAFDICTNTRI
jgi:hypothetical protein